MVQLIVGEKGKGKTKVLLDSVNTAIKEATGNIVYLDKSSKHMYELSNKVRLIDVSVYPLRHNDEFIGFICGIISQDHDLEQMYLDSFLTIAHVNGDLIETAVDDLSRIGELAAFIKENSLCGLGQTAPNPVLSTLRYFRDEYVVHIEEKRCPAGVCKNLLSYRIDPNLCRGCTACTKSCPTGAIAGSPRNPHKIDTQKCIRCGSCMEKCRFGAIVRG